MNKKIKKFVIYYDDGTYEEMVPSQDKPTQTHLNFPPVPPIQHVQPYTNQPLYRVGIADCGDKVMLNE